MCLNAHFDYFNVADVTWVWVISSARHDGMKKNVMIVQSKMDFLVGLINPTQRIL